MRDLREKTWFWAILYYLIMAILLVACVFAISRGLERVEEKGLKNIIEKVWEGNQEKSNPNIKGI